MFSAIGLSDFVPENISLMGSLFIESDSNVSIVFHDNPVALLHIASNRSLESINFTLGPGISAVVIPNMGNDSNNSFALVSGTGIQGILKAENGTLSIESSANGTIT